MRVFAGPNGSGKTTIFDQIKEKFDIGHYVNADEIEKELRKNNSFTLNDFDLKDLAENEFEQFIVNHSIIEKANEEGYTFKLEYSKVDNTIFNLNKNPNIYSYEAALIADFLRIKLIERGKKLTFETVMSHHSKLDILKLATKNGYKIYLYFICTESADINVARVLQRVNLGGHNVEEKKTRQRYKSSLELLKSAAKETYRTFVWDNSKKNGPELILEVVNGETITMNSNSLPSWVDEYLLK